MACKRVRFVLLLVLAVGLAAGAGLAAPADYADVFVMGVLGPGAPVPFLEESARVLNGANYHVVAVPRDAAVGELTASGAADLMIRYRLDALWAMRAIHRNVITHESVFTTAHFWKLELQGTLFRLKPFAGGPGYPEGDPHPWTHRVRDEVKLTGSPSDWQRIQEDADRHAVVELVAGLMNEIGYKPPDIAPPVIDVTLPKEAEFLRTSTVMLLGRVTDGTKVSSVRINGRDVSFFPQQSCPLYYPVTFPDGGELRDRLTIRLEALDVYGNASSRTVVLYRGKPIRAAVVTGWGREALLDRGTDYGIIKGMAFTAYHRRRWREGTKWHEELTLVGPGVIGEAYPHRSSITLLENGPLLKGDLVK